MEYYIYTLSNPITKEIRYIGQTKNLKDMIHKKVQLCI